MKIKSDKMTVNLSPVERVKGAGPEVEERPVEREIEIEVPIKLGASPDDPTATDTGRGLSGSILSGGTVHEVVEKMTSNCHLCRHWNNAAWLREKKRWEASPERQDRIALDDIRGVFIQTGNASLAEIEQAIEADMGLCAALTLTIGDSIITHKFASCPPFKPNGEPFLSMFAPRDRAAREEMGAIKDSIIRSATPGKTNH